MTLKQEYAQALQELEAARHSFDLADPNNFKEVDAAVYRMACAENRFASIHAEIINSQGGIAV